MSEALPAFLSNYTETIAIPEHMPMVCLVLCLFLEFDDDKHRVGQLKTLFYRHDDPDYFQKLGDAIRQDEKAQKCLADAMQAAIDGQIEQYDKDYDFDRFERDTMKTPEFYTVSFLAWAEGAGHVIPEYIMKELKTRIDHYFQSKAWRDEERRKFPPIDRQDFIRRTNEPLWQMTDAILYALGYQSRTAEDGKINFLKYKDRTKRLMTYALDAQKAHDLKLYDFDDHLFDVHQKDIEEERLKSFYSSKVKPKEFVAWLGSLALDIPILDGKIEGAVSSHVQAGGYTTPYIDLMIKAIRDLKISKDNQPPVKNIQEWLGQQNPDLSEREKGYMATFLRYPEMKKGGYHGKSKNKG